MKWSESMVDGIRIGVILLALGWLALQDMKTRKVRVSDLFVVSVALLAAGMTEQVELRIRVGGFIFGLLVLSLCKLSAEALGMADGFLILVYGVSFGLQSVSFLCFVSFLFAAAVAGGLFLLRRIGRKGRIPYLPFFLAGYLVTLMI